MMTWATLEITAITFFIQDNEWDDDYEYTAFFFTEEEVGAFITDNEKVGNEIRILNVEIFEGRDAYNLMREYAYLEETFKELREKA